MVVAAILNIDNFDFNNYKTNNTIQVVDIDAGSTILSPLF